MGASTICTLPEWCEIWSKDNGVQSTFEEMDPKELEHMLAPMGLGPFGREMADAFNVSVVLLSSSDSELTKE